MSDSLFDEDGRPTEKLAGLRPSELLAAQEKREDALREAKEAHRAEPDSDRAKRRKAQAAQALNQFRAYVREQRAVASDGTVVNPEAVSASATTQEVN